MSGWKARQFEWILSQVGTEPTKHRTSLISQSASPSQWSASPPPRPASRRSCLCWRGKWEKINSFLMFKYFLGNPYTSAVDGGLCSPAMTHGLNSCPFRKLLMLIFCKSHSDTKLKRGWTTLVTPKYLSLAINDSSLHAVKLPDKWGNS